MTNMDIKKLNAWLFGGATCEAPESNGLNNWLYHNWMQKRKKNIHRKKTEKKNLRTLERRIFRTLKEGGDKEKTMYNLSKLSTHTMCLHFSLNQRKAEKKDLL